MKDTLIIRDTVTVVDTIDGKPVLVSCKQEHIKRPEIVYRRITDDVYLLYYGSSVKDVLNALEEIKTKTKKVEYEVEETELSDGIIIKMEF